VVGVVAFFLVLKLKGSSFLFQNQQFGRYKVGEIIDSGGMATVYKGIDTLLSREIAIKVVHPHLIHKDETIIRFNNEAQAIASLSHENIVKIYDFGEQKDAKYIIMEYIEGKTLDQILQDYFWLPNLICVEILMQIFSGISEAHRKGIIHRDIKPGNIMIDTSGTVKIMDFGIAYLAHQESITLTGTFVGSPNYISPEQARGVKVSGKTDVFSTGAVAYQCMTGSVPFFADSPHATVHAILHDPLTPPLRINKKTLVWLSDFIESCLAKNVNERPDAFQCMSILEKKCTEDSIDTGKKRLIQFLESSSHYKKREEQELFNAMRNKAVKDLHRKRVVSALRSYNQARVFGQLSDDDEKVLKTNRRYHKSLKILLYGSSILITGVAVAIIFIRSWQNQQRTGKDPTETFIQEPSIPLANSLDSVTDSSLSTRDTNPIKDQRDTIVRSLSKKETENGKFIHQQKEHKSIQKPIKKVQKNTSNRDTTIAKDGYVTILTRPPFAHVSIDGIPLGKTPRATKLLPLKAGIHTITITRKNMNPITKKITLYENDTIILEFDLISPESKE